MKPSAFTLAAFFLWSGCEGRVQSVFENAGGGNSFGAGGGDAVGSGGSGGTGVGDGGVRLDNLDVFTRLSPSCAGCHTRDERPFFASLEAFENIIVFDARWIVAGQPENSTLLKYLDGSGARPMPPAPSQNFSLLDAAQATAISMIELRDWILHLPPRTAPGPTDFVNIRRKSAEQVLSSLFLQLGLANDDIYGTIVDPAWIPGTLPLTIARDSDTYAAWSPDAIPTSYGGYPGYGLFYSLGGAGYLEGKERNSSISPNFLMTLTHLSQSWCKIAVSKPTNRSIFIEASSSDVSSTSAGATKIKANIAALYLKMLGEPASGLEVEDLFVSVFQKYETKGSIAAWAATCAALVRDPLWILY
jgi:hypothetical protein